MDNSFDQQSSDIQSKLVILGSLKQIFDSILNWLVAPFMLTEEEKKGAGIYRERLGRDE